MGAVRIQTGATEPVQVYVVGANGAALTGLTDIAFRLRRFSDGFFYDFNDATFKTAGAVITINSPALTEPDATNAPGVYHRASGFAFSGITNPTAGPTTEEQYLVIWDQAVGTNARLPAPSEVREGGYVDYLDATLSNIEADTQDIQSRLPAALVTGRMDSDVGAMQAGTVTAAAIATDAIDAGAIAADAIGSSELATSAVNEIRDSILSDSTPFAGANIDAAISSRSSHSAADSADAVWDEAIVAHSGVGSAGLELQGKAAAGDAMDLVAGAVDAAAIATDAIDADALALTAINEIRDGILADSTTFNGADIATILADTAAMQPTIATNLDATVSSRASQVSLDALNNLAAQDVRDALKLTPTVGVPAAGSVDEHLDDILVDTTAIDGRLPTDPADESLQQASHTQTQADIAALNNPTAAGVADAVWDEPVAGHVAVGSAGLELQDKAAPGDAMDLVAGAVDAAAIATDAIDADAIAADAIGASELATSAVNEIRDSILSDATPFAGANIDAAVSTRAVAGDAMALTPAERGAVADVVWDEPAAGHVAVGSTGEQQNRLDATVSSRSDFDETADPVELLDAGGTAGSSAAELVTDIEADLASNHGAGQWDGTDADWTVAEREQIRYRLALDGTQTNPVTGVGTIEDIITDTTAIDGRLPADPADESLQQAAHTQTQADIAALNDLADQDVRDAMKLTPTVGIPSIGSVDEHLDVIEADTTALDARLPLDPADESLQQAAHTQTQSDIAALNDLSQADVQAALTAQGYTVARAPKLDNLDASVGGVGVTILAAVAALNDLNIAGVQTALTNQGYTVARAPLLDNLDSAVSAVLSAIGALNDLGASEVENAVWDATQAAHVAVGSMGEAQGASSTGDWSDAEQKQIRDALGVDGVKTAATGGQVQEIRGAGFTEATDSLEGLSKQIGRELP